MTPDATLVAAQDVAPLRDLYRREMNCQIVLDSWLARAWVDPYVLRLDGRVVGYGCVGDVRGKRKDLVTEFYVLPAHRAAALPLFRRLIAASRARRVEVQTNDVLFTLMVFDCAARIKSETILFHDALTTAMPAPPGATFRRATEADAGRTFEHKVEPVGDHVIELNGKIAATGGILFHYNLPYGDIYMEVAEPFRRRGCGSYLIQELKRVCYEMGRVPAARCGVKNAASRATLQKAGLHPCARVLTGVLPA
jgi:GNAT superfamily N-acetyltransferase